ncbi:hypothetical protein ACG74X_00930 [Marivita sp. S0852]|uniref:hypothetical protein n=1 Tax=Marivita sp. S0852 TaxID=3373893 RepID=UPI0039824C66
MNEAALVLAAGGGAGALFWLHNRDKRQAKARRLSVFDNCKGVLDQAEMVHSGRSYPDLVGQFGGGPAELKLISDTVQLRKLPILWLSVTLERQLPIPAVFDMMIRPANTEFFSPHGSFRETVATPPDWHEHAVIRTDDPTGVYPFLDLLAPHVADLVSDDRGKELLVTPRGIRLIWRVSESVRGHYLLTRQPQYEQDQLVRSDVQRLLDLACAIEHDIRKGAA